MDDKNVVFSKKIYHAVQGIDNLFGRKRIFDGLKKETTIRIDNSTVGPSENPKVFSALCRRWMDGEIQMSCLGLTLTYCGASWLHFPKANSVPEYENI